MDDSTVGVVFAFLVGSEVSTSRAMLVLMVEGKREGGAVLVHMWVVVKIMVSFWVLSIMRHLVVSGPNRGP